MIKKRLLLLYLLASYYVCDGGLSNMTASDCMYFRV